MKTVILAGGLGTRISEETHLKPKPMVEIGGKPILWHIMKIYSAHGINEFVICCGYKGYVIKEYFANYLLHMSDVTFDIKRDKVEIHHNNAEPWRVTLIDTGDGTGTGGRIKRVESYLDNETFCLTYGDGLGDINIRQLLDFHRQQNTLATLTAVQPPGRYGAFSLTSDQSKIPHFREKPKGDGAWVNGGFFVLEPAVMNYIDGDPIFWEAEPLSRLAEDGELSAYRHYGYWQSMDTLRDKNVLEDLWRSGKAPWKIW
ncbi:MAG TPA: glucose-1-phosphate cytidylyltransferase [Gammaproteobacteria bacterium]|nr:glucose-1-phosphate cytidylyltransferase [Gammaproteobacteria bacterium]